MFILITDPEGMVRTGILLSGFCFCLLVQLVPMTVLRICTGSGTHTFFISLYYYYLQVSNVSFSANLRILTCQRKSTVSQKVSSGHRRSEEPTEDVLDGNKHSPYPEIDAFILSVIQKGCSPAFFRRWVCIILLFNRL